jgi:hypothetical protein
VLLRNVVNRQLRNVNAQNTVERRIMMNSSCFAKFDVPRMRQHL